MGTPFLGQRAIYGRDKDAPLAALVTAVREDGTVNLCVFRANGETTNRTAVPVGGGESFYCLLKDETADLKKELDVAHLAIGALSDRVDALGDALDKLSAPKGTPPVAPTN